ncbi:hypothetical protein RM550_00735 [Streptomyces sp. DSM 41527]|uniref:Uncharacterized protein n=1 Tax=Streptomyces mooreae TaxID=3075523 RepID=A0ABU2T0Y2_9ACTN|nr:hypothetical protein [Streptomyces sp. DSM 41527]MDT0454264.1 hypothetical protein [Streptomyces sp. DSM 41527]
MTHTGSPHSANSKKLVVALIIAIGFATGCLVTTAFIASGSGLKDSFWAGGIAFTAFTTLLLLAAKAAGYVD